MGFKAWRNIGAFACAGLSLVGCASTPPQQPLKTYPPPTTQPSGASAVPPQGMFPTVGQPTGLTGSSVGQQPNLNVPPANRQQSPWGTSVPNPTMPATSAQSSSSPAPSFPAPNQGSNTYSTTPNAPQSNALGGYPSAPGAFSPGAPAPLSPSSPPPLPAAPQGSDGFGSMPQPPQPPNFGR